MEGKRKKERRKNYCKERGEEMGGERWKGNERKREGKGEEMESRVIGGRKRDDGRGGGKWKGR